MATIKPIKVSITSSLNTLKRLYTRSESNLVEAAKLAVKMVRQDTTNYAAILKKLNIAEWTLDRLLKLGSGKIARELMFHDSIGATCLESYSIRTQKFHIKNGFDIVRRYGARSKTINRSLQEVTMSDASRLFDLENKVVRTPDEQLNHLSKFSTVKLEPRFECKGIRLVVNRPCVITLTILRQLVSILSKNE